MQHLIVRLRKFRPALGQILDDHSEKTEDTDTAMMTWGQFEQAWTVINPKFNAKSRVSTSMQNPPPPPPPPHTHPWPTRGQGVCKSPNAALTPLPPPSLLNFCDLAFAAVQAALYNMVCQKQLTGDGAKKARKSDAALKAPRKSQHGPTGGSKGSDSKEKVAVRKDLVEQVICSEVDFLFCSSWT